MHRKALAKLILRSHVIPPHPCHDRDGMILRNTAAGFIELPNTHHATHAVQCSKP